MWTRKAIASMLLAAGMIGTTATPLSGLAATSIEIDIGPPPPRYEAVPAPRPGYVWAAGYWGWEGERHAWHRGHWVAERPGYAYHAPHWVEHNGRWQYHASRWDRDGDGVPDRHDARPDNPHRH